MCCAPGVETTKQPKKGRGIGSMEKCKRLTPNPGTQKISKKASGPRHALTTQKGDGWMDNPQNVSSKAKADISLKSLPLRV